MPATVTSSSSNGCPGLVIWATASSQLSVTVHPSLSGPTPTDRRVVGAPVPLRSDWRRNGTGFESRPPIHTRLLAGSSGDLRGHGDDRTMTDQTPQIPVPHGLPFNDLTPPAAVGSPTAVAETTAAGPSTPMAEDTPTAAGAAAPPDPVVRRSRRRGPVVLPRSRRWPAVASAGASAARSCPRSTG